MVLIDADVTTSKDLAFRLGLSERTMRIYLNAIYKKYGVSSRYELIIKRWRERIDELEAVCFIQRGLIAQLREELGQR